MKATNRMGRLGILTTLVWILFMTSGLHNILELVGILSLVYMLVFSIIAVVKTVKAKGPKTTMMMGIIGIFFAVFLLISASFYLSATEIIRQNNLLGLGMVGTIYLVLFSIVAMIQSRKNINDKNSTDKSAITWNKIIYIFCIFLSVVIAIIIIKNGLSDKQANKEDAVEKDIKKLKEPEKSSDKLYEVTRIVTQKYANDMLKEVIYYKGNKEIAKEEYAREGNMTKTGRIPDGIVREYGENGILVAEYTFKDDKLNGLTKMYYENGALWMEANYKNGRNHGLKRYYFENGNLMTEKNYKDGKLNGFIKEYDIYRNLVQTQEYKDNKLEENSDETAEVTEVTKRYSNSNRKEVVFYEGNKEIAKEEYDIDGNITTKTGKIPDGMVKEYDEDGILMVKSIFKDSKRNGLSKMYHQGGELMSETNYKDDKVHGLMRVYLENGIMMLESNFKNGKKDGPTKYYDKNGNLFQTKEYKDGKLNGFVKTYDEDGGPNFIEEYKDGKIIQ